MNANLNELLGTVTDFLQSEAKTETIIGKQFQLGDFSCVPVMSVSIGLGSVGGEGKGKGGAKDGPEGEGEGGAVGAGGGVNITPLGFLVAHGEQVSFISSQHSKGLSAAFEKVPDLLSKYFEQEKSKES